ncbi:MAG TPA: hypothetical protein VFL77_07915 [Solirubrobacterales bacterium]|nr:hypothetical protein [Solirubrobacterales bacterium]
MRKKIMLLALAVAGAAAFTLPAVAVAEDVPEHIVPIPTQASSVHGGAAILQARGGTSVSCQEVSGIATWESTTRGKITLTFSNDCTESAFKSSCGEIVTTELQFDLVSATLERPYFLITSNAGHFATFTCGGGLLQSDCHGQRNAR